MHPSIVITDLAKRFSFSKALYGIRHDLLIGFFAIVATISFIPIFTYLYFAADLTSEETIMSKKDAGVILLDKQDRPFFTFYSAKFRKEIPLSEIPKTTQQAIIAVEDKDFYSHAGFSPKAILRAFVDDLQSKSLSYGASTITQQLVKNSLLHSQKSFLRKYQEVVLAQEIERRYPKDKILQMYLNSVYFGEGAFGVEEAAHTFFNKGAKDLNLAESALLVGLLPAPSRLSPISGNFEETKNQQKIVLSEMLEQGYISPEQGLEAWEEELAINPEQSEINVSAPHFALMVRDELIAKYGEEAVAKSGFKVRTSLDLDAQEIAEKAVRDQVNALKGSNVSNGAAVVINPKTGEIRAMVGSTNWYEDSFGKVNIALSDRPPGSSFKPIIYLTALEKKIITPATVLKDAPTTFANFDESFYSSFPTRAVAAEFLKNDPNAYYKPQNYDRKFRGPVTVKRALSNSLNVPAVWVMSKVGLNNGLEMARRMGISTLKDSSNYGLSLVLGTAEVKLLEMTNIYATLANGGVKNDPTAILEIIDKKGEIIYRYQPINEKVADPKNVFLVSYILSDNKSRAEMFGNALTISRPAAVKTGTTEDYKDAWTLGYTPSLAIGVWVGNNFNEPMTQVAGSLGAAPIWRNIMERLLANTPVENFEPPEGVIRITTCGVSLASKETTSSALTDYFVKGTEPKSCPILKPTPGPAAEENSQPEEKG